MKYRALAQMLFGEPWIILPQELQVAADTLRRKRRGGRTLVRGAQAYGTGEQPSTCPPGVAVLPLTGMITAKDSWFVTWFGGTALEKWLPAFEALVADSTIDTIVLDVDSPGGHVVGTPEAAEVVFAARAKKRLIAVANGTMCSGAYWLGSACHEIVGGPSSVLGSIGAISIMAEYSKMFAERGISPHVFVSKISPRKSDGNEYEALSKPAEQQMQSRINAAGDMFVAAVAKHRDLSVDAVLQNYGQGAWMYGAAAAPAGLVDRLGTLSQVLVELGGAGSANGAGTKVATQRSRNREEAIVDPKIIAALVKRGILKDGATAAEAQAALNAYFAALGQPVPTEQAKLLAKLAKAESTDDDEVEEDEEDVETDTDDEEDDDVTPPPQRKPKKPAAGVSLSQAQRMADEAVSRRLELQTEIRAAGQILVGRGLDPKHVEIACTQQKSLKGAHAYFARMLAEEGQPVNSFGGISAGPASRDVLAKAITEVLEQRAVINVQRTVSADEAEIAGKDRDAINVAKPLSDTANQLRHKRLIDLVELSFQSFGARVDISNPAEVMRVLFGGAMLGGMVAGPSAGSYSGPSSFPNLLSNIANKSLAMRLEFAPTTYRRWCAQYQSVTDFKPRTIIGTGEYGELPRKNDNMPREQAKPISEEPSWISVEEYGDVTPFTFRMLMDDDLGAFLKSLGDKSIAADRTLNRLCVELLTGNALAQDGLVLFDAAVHKNLITGPGTDPAAASMEAMDALLMAQKGIDGERTLNLQAAFLLHPNKHKHVVRKELSSAYGLVPTTKTELNVFRDVVEPIWEPMLTDASAGAWYWGANPQVAPAILFAFMVGFESPKITQMYDWNTNVVNFATDQIFGVTVNNWRPIVQNAGA